MDKLKIGLGFACLVGGVAAYYWFSELPVVLRVLMVLAGIGIGAAVAYTSQQGREFYLFANEAWDESHRVSWPTRKETLQTTGIVFVFVVIMALFLFSVDATLAWTVRMMTGRGEQ